MYVDRLKTLSRAYSAARRSNTLYSNALHENTLQKIQLKFLSGLLEQMKTLNLLIVEKEAEWRQAILSMLETEIADYLSYVYPDDGYIVQLKPRVLRSKIHIEACVYSTIMQEIPGQIHKTQGRLFQQIVSFAALLGVMNLLGVRTVYFDEAFSGSSKRNVKKVNALLQHAEEKGFNLVIIAQDTNMAEGSNWNRLFLTRNLANVTSVFQEEGEDSG